jgi:hypothetical protein
VKPGDLIQITLMIGVRMETKTTVGILLSIEPVEPNMYDNIHDLKILTTEGNTISLGIFRGDKLEVLSENW